MNKSPVTLILAIVSLSPISDVVADAGKLIAVAVLYSDGDKSPSSSFPNDPYFNVSYWPMGFGQLTEQGIRHQYELGQWLRQRYDGFLPQKYSPSDIYVRSTDTHTALMSAEANLAGLYPPTDSQVWNKDLMWQPIPVHTVPKELDQVLYMEKPCPKYDQLYDKVCGNYYFSEVNRIHGYFFENVYRLTGWKINDVSYLTQLQAVLYSYSSYNTSFLPDWYSTFDLERLEWLASVDFDRHAYNEDLKRLKDGPFLDYLIKNFDGVVGGTGAPKFLMMSAHERTVASVLKGMFLFDNRTPEFASCLIWELRRNDTGALQIDFFYKKNATTEAEHLKLFHDEICSYSIFRGDLTPVTIDLETWDKECADVDDTI